eukprot:CAMPEP_0177695746 /NCGR_PEP_ID=MMETSP0484_2-20121128/3620_1 /TAXON_ID=354590 /ORGANISM="Rhodomonas lens, Strain RHODO" /LENGTH=533 /DNA_ID=CAMNT_0019206689 /DNA_START=117 /DNA_END=1717 /DNA_ORIENTATION=-
MLAAVAASTCSVAGGFVLNRHTCSQARVQHDSVQAMALCIAALRGGAGSGVRGLQGVAVTSKAIFSQGSHTLAVDRKMHAENRGKVVSEMKKLGAKDSGLVVVQGGGEMNRAETDHEMLFRQESNFHYLFGVEFPGCYGAIEVGSGAATLFVPRQPDAYAVWMGTPPTLEELKEQYAVDRVMYVDEMTKFLSKASPELIHVYGGENSDSGNPGQPARFEGSDAYTLESDMLHRGLHESRVVKSAAEVEILRFANKIASAAHTEVMRRCKPGMMEYQLEAIFLHHCYMHGGMRNAAYTPIAGSGPNAAVLHYGHAGAPNSRQMQDGDLVLNDMGAEYYCYASDITCSFPVNGKFTPDQRALYATVLKAKEKRGCVVDQAWDVLVDMHELAEKIIANGLVEMGVLTGDLDGIIEAQLPAVFMPHGLGHNLGLDTHDVGGYPKGATRATRPGLKSLRNVRELKEGMVLTVEPGCYFIESEIKNALKDPAKAKYMKADKALSMIGKGGVRLEDNVLVTSEGVEVFTSVPRTIDELEA